MASASGPSDAGRPTTERVRGIFSSIAEDYDAFNRLASLGIDKGWRREMVKAARLTGESRVVDL
jgi:demethylmenaquinone methyltransferase/2-methoxy-6-polyprenyl-1,4-benzoquinol methylase